MSIAYSESAPLAEAPVVNTVATVDTSRSGVSWAAIFAGAMAAASLSLLLFILGTGLGLSSVSVWSGEGLDAGALGLTAVAWIAFTQLASAGVGGYLAGRLRTRWQGVHTDEVYFRDTAHGFLSWALATLAMVALMGAAAGGAVSGAFKAAQTVATSASSVVGGAIGAAGGAAAGGAAAMAGASGADASPQGLAYWTGSLFRNSGAATSTSNATPADLASATREAGVIFAQSLRTGQLSPADEQYLAQLIARNSDMSVEDAQKKVRSTFDSVQMQIKQAEQKADEAKQKAKQAAEEARKATAHSMLWLFVSLMLGAFVGSLCATWGGRQRDAF
ncbi:hypothetical protein KP729_002562|uniref:hypothetical protein n=1 Tax=Delftia acidovorans TaxID=80866 RepID=UPI001C0AB8B9|nr:hypothetical protein [Delftia acidovorans]MCA1069190.1 hypothetical protein [Delftia acidovorans]